MSVQPQGRIAPFGAISIFKAVSSAENLKTKFTNWNARRKTENQLMKLTSRELADIGIEPGNVSNFVANMKF